MATDYPTSLDTLTNPGGTDQLSSGHASQHANANDAIEALQAKLGTTSTPAKLPVGLVVGKAKGTGIKVDPDSPTTTWRDLLGNTAPKSGGANAPTLAVMRGGRTQSYFYSVGDRGDDWYHIPHDWAGTDLHLHVHWGHNGTSISGTFTVTCYLTYAKRDSIYQAEITTTISRGSLNLTLAPQWCQRVDEIQLSAASPTASQLDTDNIEVDGVIRLHYEVTAIPTIGGGSTNEPYIEYVDIHYESTNVGTKNKVADFYTYGLNSGDLD